MSSPMKLWPDETVLHFHSGGSANISRSCIATAPYLLHLHKGLTRRSVACIFAGKRLPTPNCGIDIARIKFNPVAAASSAFGSNKGRAAAKKWIEDGAASC